MKEYIGVLGLTGFLLFQINNYNGTNVLYYDNIDRENVQRNFIYTSEEHGLSLDGLVELNSDKKMVLTDIM